MGTSTGTAFAASGNRTEPERRSPDYVFSRHVPFCSIPFNSYLGGETAGDGFRAEPDSREAGMVREAGRTGREADGGAVRVGACPADVHGPL